MPSAMRALVAPPRTHRSMTARVARNRLGTPCTAAWPGERVNAMGTGDVLLLASDGGPPGLLAARQQMAVSLGFHIVLACFGVAFPALIFAVHARGAFRGDPVALSL